MSDIEIDREKRGFEEVHERVTEKRANKRATHRREHTTVLVKNLPKSVNQAKVRRIFGDCGRIRNIDVVESLDGSYRWAKIEFWTPDECLSALTKNYKIVGKNQISVTILKECTLWITNFPPSYDQKQLRNIFKSINVVVLSIRMPSKKFNSNRRFAYVDVTSVSDLNRCIEELNNSTLDGYKLVVKCSNPNDRAIRTDAATLERREVFFRNLDPEWLGENGISLRKSLEEFGEIEAIHIPKFKSGTHNACAFVTFKSYLDANKCLSLTGGDIGGRCVSVTLADQKSFLDRQIIKSIMNNRFKGNISKENIVSLHPINDKISKEQICQYIMETGDIVDNKSDIDDVYLVTDYQGALIKFKDSKLAAKCILKLQGQKFYNRTIECGSVNDLRKSKKINKQQRLHSEAIKSTISANPTSDPTTNITKTINPVLTTTVSSASVEKTDTTIKLNTATPPASKANMSNDDFRKMFLGQ